MIKIVELYQIEQFEGCMFYIWKIISNFQKSLWLKQSFLRRSLKALIPSWLKVNMRVVHSLTAIFPTPIYQAAPLLNVRLSICPLQAADYR